MRPKRAGIFIAYCDLLLVIVSLLIVSVAPKKVADGIHVEAQYLIIAEWDRMLDEDVDLWGVGPPDENKPVFYKNLEGGALSLDRDSRGYLDDRLNVDGRYVYLPHKETMTIRGVVPGRYSFAVHLYKHREIADHPVDPHNLNLVVHVEVIRINPKVQVIFRRDVTLAFEGDAINFWSMDLLPDGSFREADPPVEPLTSRFYRIESQLGAAHPPQAP